MPNLKLPIYLDAHSTTPLDRRVFDVMKKTFEEDFGNASSPHHAFGIKANDLVEDSRKKVSSLIHAKSDEIIFTSGSTESNNLALKGVCEVYKDKGKHVITCVTEHSSILDTCQSLERAGFEVTYLPVDSNGIISIEKLKEEIKDETILISVALANNEIGVLQPIEEIGKIAKEKNILFHSDITQATSFIPIDVNQLGLHLASFSAHKMYGPKGVGALYIRSENPRVRISPMIDGGGHEKGLRSGTLNTSGIVGFGEACHIASSEMEQDSAQVAKLRDKLKDGVLSELEGVTVNGSLESRLPNNLSLSFSYVGGESLLKSFKDVALSSSSACSSANLEVSYVLKALGLKEELIHSTIRFGLLKSTTEEEIDFVIKEVVKNVNHLRSLSTLYKISQEKGSDYLLAKYPGGEV